MQFLWGIWWFVSGVNQWTAKFDCPAQGQQILNVGTDLYYGTTDAVYKSTDAADTWTKLDAFGGVFMAFDPIDRLLYTTSPGHVRVSTSVDGGTPTFSDITTSLLQPKHIAVTHTGAGAVLYVIADTRLYRAIRAGGPGTAWGAFTIASTPSGEPQAVHCRTNVAQCWFSYTSGFLSTITVNSAPASDNWYEVQTVYYLGAIERMVYVDRLYYFARWHSPPNYSGGEYVLTGPSGPAVDLNLGYAYSRMSHVATDGSRVFLSGEPPEFWMFRGTLGNDASYTRSENGLTNGIYQVAFSGSRVAGAGYFGVYTLDEVPFSVTGVSPATGYSFGDSTFEITGTGFAPNSYVNIGDQYPKQTTVSADGTKIVVRTGPQPPGEVTWSVVSGSAGSATGPFHFTRPPPPVVDDFTPTQGASLGGTEFTVTGNGFLAPVVVLFGDRPAVIASVTNTEIKGYAPASTIARVEVTFFNGDGQQASATRTFDYAQGPSIAALTPTDGGTDGGTRVTLTGAYFTAGMSVELASVPATDVTVVNDKEATFVTPPHAAGVVPLLVRNPDGQVAGLGGAYSYHPVLAQTGTTAVQRPDGVDDNREAGDLTARTEVPACNGGGGGMLGVCVALLARRRRR